MADPLHLDIQDIPDTRPTSSDREALEVSAWWSVVRAYLECSRRYGQMLAHHELTVTQFDVLSTIETLGGDAVPKTIASRLVVSRANITGVLQRLTERDLVQTQPHGDDARSFVCALTPRGKRQLAKARAAASRFVTAQLAPFGDDDMRLVKRFMGEMNRHLQTLDPAALAGVSESPRSPTTGRSHSA